MPIKMINLMVYLNESDVREHGGLYQTRDKITKWLNANIFVTQEKGIREHSAVKTLEGEDLDFLRERVWFAANFHREIESDVVADHFDLGSRCEWCGNFHVERDPATQAIIGPRWVDHSAEIRIKEQDLLKRENGLKTVP